MANKRKERIDTAKTFLAVIARRLKDAKFIGDDGMELYLVDDNILELRFIHKEVPR